MATLNYNRFKRNSMKARISWVQEKLIALGYLIEGESQPTKRDKAFINAFKKFQADNGFTTNAEIHEQEFDILNSVKIK